MSGARPSRPEASPLRGHYLVQHRLWRAWLRTNDAVLALSRGRQDTPVTPSAPKRVLVCVGGHLGDAVIATKAISQLHRAAPGIEIGVLSGSWNRHVFEGHPRVRWFHSVDHWKINRVETSLPRRWLSYLRSRSSAVHAIRAVSYDAAVDLYAYYPNFASTVSAAGIPIRVGYVSGGFGPLYTHRLEWKPGRSITDDHRAVLERLLPSLAWDERAGYELSAITADTARRLKIRLDRLGLVPRKYVVLHVGGGAPHKEWPIQNWLAVARGIAGRDLGVMLTGAGSSEMRLARAIEAAVPGVCDLTGQFSWDEFRCAIANAALLLSIDTVAMHVAAAHGTPCVAVVTGIESPGRWMPIAGDLHVLTHPVPCAPCFRSKGCNEMLCVRGVDSDAMLRAANRHLSNHTS